MKKDLLKKGIVLTVILLFLGAGIPNINGIIIHEGIYILKRSDSLDLYDEIETDTFDDKQYVIIFYQPPASEEEGYAALSEDPYIIYENLWGINGDVKKIIWWGLCINYQGKDIKDGDPEGMNFYMRFYDDSSEPENAPPIDLVSSFNIKPDNLIANHTEIFWEDPTYGLFELIKFEYTFHDSINLTEEDGWISIQSYDDPDGDKFCWAISSTGDNYLYHNYFTLDDDAALQLLREQNAPCTPKINGATSGSAGKEKYYNFSATDPDGDNISYCIDWGDESEEFCIGPFPSGEEITSSHSWNEEGDYTLRVKARDTYGAESNYATLQVSMPKTNKFNRPFLKFIENHPNMFPMLEKLLVFFELILNFDWR